MWELFRRVSLSASGKQVESEDVARIWKEPPRVRYTTATFLPLAFFSDCNSLSCAGCFILTTQLLMAYVLPSLS